MRAVFSFFTFFFLLSADSAASFRQALTARSWSLDLFVSALAKVVAALDLATKKAKDQLRAVKASRKLAAESADKVNKKVKNEKTARIAAERRAKLHAERAANSNHNAWLDKKVSLKLF